MKKKAFIITLTGPSACGKTYITNKIIDLETKLIKEGYEFHPKRFFKYVTRPYRENEVIEKNKGVDIDVMSVRAIPKGDKGCELVYRTYGFEYGIKKQDLKNLLDKNISPIVVINDVRVVEELKREFKGQVLSLFIFRDIIPDVKEHLNIGTKRGAISQDISITRFEKAVALYRIFIENIIMFDRVILNIKYEGTDRRGRELKNIAEIQIENIIKGVFNGKLPLSKKINKSPKLFIISGNVASGKDDIIKAANNMGKLQTDILKKYTTRWQEADDEDEIICKYTPRLELINKYNQKYEKEILSCHKSFSFLSYKEENKGLILQEYNKKGHDFKCNCSFEEYCQAKFEIALQKKLNEIKTGIEQFWEKIKDNERERSVPDKNDKEILELPEQEYLKMRKLYFELNPKYIDIENIKEQNQNQVNEEILKILDKSENKSYKVNHGGKDYVLYQNNNLYNKPVNYGFEISSIKETWLKRKNHIVLTASLPNIFRVCKEYFGSVNVITAFTYSQISQIEHLNNSDMVMGKAKLKEYEDILRYANHILDFDYALIYAETSLTNKTGNQKDELVDQIFRLFRAYNK